MPTDQSFREAAATADEQVTPMDAFLKAAIATLGFAWTLAREVGQIASPCRFSALVIAVGGFALLATGAGSEVIAGFRTGKSQWPWASHAQFWYFQFAVLFWAYNSWFWARHALEENYGEYEELPADAGSAERRLSWLWYATPRALALAAYGTVILAMAISDVDVPLILTTAVFAIFFLIYVWKRRAITEKLQQAGEYGAKQLHIGAVEVGARITTTYQRLRRSDRSKPQIDREDV